MRARVGNRNRIGVVVGMLVAVLPAAGCDSSNRGSGADGMVADSPAEATGGPTVNVSYRGGTQVADLSKPAIVRIGGLPFVALSDVVTGAYPDIDLSKVTADFTGGDGFMPGSKANCATLIPVNGTLLAKGFISPESRNLAWDDTLQYPGCMRVGDTAEIVVVDR